MHDAFVAEGAAVGVLERDAAKADDLRRAVPSTIVVTGDATSPGDNDAAVNAVVERHGGLDVLVSCVGVFDFNRGVRDLGRDELVPAFDELFHVNVASMLVSVQSALAPLTASRGAVVLTASTSGFYAGRGGTLYVASKFAVRGLVVALAHELAPDIRVNGVAPGGTVGTDLRGPAALGLDGRSLADRPGREDDLRARTPLAVGADPGRHRRQLRVPGVGRRTRHHRDLRPPRRRHRRQGLALEPADR